MNVTLKRLVVDFPFFVLCMMDGLFFLVVEEDSGSLVHHLPVGCVEWCFLVFGLVLGTVLVVDAAQAV
jgi:ABC-type sulfate transport system permease subunit